jgi:hypothetical protein
MPGVRLPPLPTVAGAPFRQRFQGAICPHSGADKAANPGDNAIS